MQVGGTEWVVGAVWALPTLAILVAGGAGLLHIGRSVGRIESQIKNGLDKKLAQVCKQTDALDRRLHHVETHLAVMRSYCPVCREDQKK